jgi:hypothetical protein
LLEVNRVKKFSIKGSNLPIHIFFLPFFFFHTQHNDFPGYLQLKKQNSPLVIPTCSPFPLREFVGGHVEAQAVMRETLVIVLKHLLMKPPYKLSII